MYRTPLLLLFTLSFLSCIAQNEESLNGQWYMINKSGFVEWTIGSNSLSLKKLYSNFAPKNGQERVFPITKKVSLLGRFLFWIGDPEWPTDKYFTRVEFVPANNGQRLICIWKGIKTSETTETIVNLNNEDRRDFRGFILYSKGELEIFKEKRSIKEMSSSEFNEFKMTFERNLQRFKPEDEQYLSGFGAGSTFTFQMAISTLMDLGYNPIQTSDSINALFAKFKETKDKE